ncbi:putative division protein, FtsQ-type [Gottschalkia purinilytica]|uniref:Putative division protein, FtsQ-type n=1 Tax=Gottschalkia purinilytica TaxID=1503 RepID=A0A0L0WEM7_GOTPU|nr:FtsQ-type POTRA domain-containing protein [Gottschalkia purinilytica]KNF09919.1 putative division protein, FtsQ-type [Gottschalkia purinilytica]
MKTSSKVDKKIKTKKKRLNFVLLILMISLLFIVVTKTPLFNISKIEVKGNKVLDKDTVVMASGIILDENIFKVNTGDAKESLFIHPYIKSADVKRELPNKILIDITESKEIAAIAYNSSYIYIDKNGKILDIISSEKNDILVKVEGLDLINPSIGNEIRYKNKIELSSMKEFLEEIDQNNFKKNISMITFEEGSSMTIEMKTGTKVAFGVLDNVKYKVDYIKRIFEDLKAKNRKASKIYLNRGKYAIVEQDGKWEDSSNNE